MFEICWTFLDFQQTELTQTLHLARVEICKAANYKHPNQEDTFRKYANI